MHPVSVQHSSVANKYLTIFFIYNKLKEKITNLQNYTYILIFTIILRSILKNSLKTPFLLHELSLYRATDSILLLSFPL